MIRSLPFKAVSVFYSSPFTNSPRICDCTSCLYNTRPCICVPNLMKYMKRSCHELRRTYCTDYLHSCVNLGFPSAIFLFFYPLIMLHFPCEFSCWTAKEMTRVLELSSKLHGPAVHNAKRVSSPAFTMDRVKQLALGRNLKTGSG